MRHNNQLLIKFFLILLSFLFSKTAVADWRTDYTTPNSVHLTVPGEITHGDKFHFRLVKDHCENANLLTFVYTTAPNSNFASLNDKLVTAKFGGLETQVRLVTANKFLAGHRIMVDLGWVPISVLSEIFRSEQKIELKFEDHPDFKASNYMDILKNSWNFGGFDDAIIDAQKQCLKL